MKVIAILLSLTSLVSIAFAQQEPEPMHLVTPTQTNTIALEEPEVAPMESPRWNLSLGISQFDSGDFYDFKGRGLTIEMQRRFGQAFFVGASYTNYNTESVYLTNYVNSETYNTRQSLDTFTASLELHPIRLELPKQSEFFAAIVGGMMATAQEYSRLNSYYYGAGIGFNYNNQIGVRADLKSNRDFRAFSSFALIGYY